MSAAPRHPIVLIPSRLQSVRLPAKPLADIHGEPMIVHVWRRAIEADVGRVVVACAESQIADAIERAGGEAVLTRAGHPSGTDRIHEALERIDPAGRHDVVINVQGDLPTVARSVIVAALETLEVAQADIGTVVAEIHTDREREDPSVVKAVLGLPPGARSARALYFSRTLVPTGQGPLYHHIGLYAFRREVLRRFVALPQGVLERRERLEQLRALEAGMTIWAALVDTVPLGVDTPADLERARELLGPKRPN
jgi:3-deoxy-manno-octulosonate cytidylyltransferase (CMP-KDO synthetase)